ncbi:MAG: putative zinc-binding metallopeptidase [Elusimicrobiota bacterium]
MPDERDGASDTQKGPPAGGAGLGLGSGAEEQKAAGRKPKSRRQSPSRLRPDRRPIDWENISDEELLRKRICDLPLSIEGTELEERIQTVYGELEARGILFRPEVYLGDEWFSPEGDPVISIPFYLAHPRLIRLQRSRVLEAEGETRAWFLQLLRHEMGHALMHAYGLHRSRGYRKVFGKSSQPYPEKVRTRPYSRKYVRHLEDWYAQSHPDEDFSETFAVWLTPDIDWHEQYAGWGALKKLELVDRMMSGIRGRKPKKRTGPKYRRLSKIRMTIAQYHRITRKALEEDFPDFFDGDLKAIFSPEGGADGERAAKFLRRHRRMLVRGIAQWTGEKRYTIHHLVTRFAERCAELGLYVHLPESETLAQASACLTAMAAHYFLTGKFKRRL